MVALDLGWCMRKNSFMTIPGRVHNGVVLLEGDTTLPEGTAVVVSTRLSPAIRVAKKQQRVSLPFVRSDRPGSIDLTAERIAELLDEQDASS